MPSDRLRETTRYINASMEHKFVQSVHVCTHTDFVINVCTHSLNPTRKPADPEIAPIYNILLEIYTSYAESYNHHIQMLHVRVLALKHDENIPF